MSGNRSDISFIITGVPSPILLVPDSVKDSCCAENKNFKIGIGFATSILACTYSKDIKFMI